MKFCGTQGWDPRAGAWGGPAPVPALQLRLIAWVLDLFYAGLAYSTINKYLGSVIANFFGLFGADPPVKRSMALAIVMAGVNKCTDAVRHSNPISAALLQRVLAPLRCTVHDEMTMRTAIIVAWCAGWRVSQYTAAPTLQHAVRVSDVWLWPFAAGFSPTMVSLWRKSSKTAQANTAPPRASWLGSAPPSPVLCPVAHLVAYLQMRRWNATPAEPLFLLTNGEPLQADVVRAYLHSREKPLQLTRGHLRPQGLRSGGATALAMVGASSRTIHMWGGWSDPAMSKSLSNAYLRDLRAHMEGLTEKMLTTTVTDFSHGAPAMAAIGTISTRRLAHPAGAATPTRR